MGHPSRFRPSSGRNAWYLTHEPRADPGQGGCALSALNRGGRFLTPARSRWRLPPKLRLSPICLSAGPSLGLKATGQSVVAYDTSQPDPDRTVVRLQVMEQGIPVIGSEFIVHLDATRDILSVTGETVRRTGIATAVSVDPAIAIATARDLVSKTYQVSPDALTVTTPELWIYDPDLIGPGGGFPTTVWRMEVTPVALLPIREFVLVDTERGAVVLHFNQVETALNRETYTANNTTVLPGTLVCNEANPLLRRRRRRSRSSSHVCGRHLQLLFDAPRSGQHRRCGHDAGFYRPLRCGIQQCLLERGDVPVAVEI